MKEHEMYEDVPALELVLIEPQKSNEDKIRELFIKIEMLRGKKQKARQ